VDPLLAADGARIDVAGVPAVDGLSFRTSGGRVLVLGAARALFQAAAGLRAVTRGELRVEGLAPRAALRAGVAACAPLDPPLPAAWTVRRYLTWSARIAGNGRREAGALATDAIARLELGLLVTMKLGRVGEAAKRAVVVAAALATGAKTLLLEDPMSDLAPEVARPIARVMARATSDRRTALFAARIPLESPLALDCDEAVLVDGAAVAQGAPAELAAAARTYSLRVRGDPRELARAVEARGARLVAVTDTGGAAGGDGHGRVIVGALIVDLGEAVSTTDLLRIAADSHTVVLELRPLTRAFG
jgi:ABC-type multidrug transport system ATPase subunit